MRELKLPRGNALDATRMRQAAAYQWLWRTIKREPMEKDDEWAEACQRGEHHHCIGAREDQQPCRCECHEKRKERPA